MKPVGTGPYKFVSHTPGVELVCEAFEGYWRKPPAIKRLVFKVVPDEATRLAKLRDTFGCKAFKIRLGTPGGRNKDAAPGRSEAYYLRVSRWMSVLFGVALCGIAVYVWLGEDTGSASTGFGVLALGHKESVVAGHEDRYEILDPGEKLYRRKR